MPAAACETGLPETHGPALCRLARGVPDAVDEDALRALTERGLVTVVPPAEAHDAERFLALAAEGDRRRAGLQQMRPPGGLAALVPGAGARFRQRRAACQAQLDATDEERREIERRYRAAARERWPRLPYALGTAAGGRILVTPDGCRAACAFWSGPNALPDAAVCASRLAAGAARAAAFARALTAWRLLPPETAWVCAALLGRVAPELAEQAVGVLRTLHQWLERQEFWWDDPLAVATILAGTAVAGDTARAAAAAYESLHPHLGTGPETFAAACRLEARAGWVPGELRAQSLHALLKPVADLGLSLPHRAASLVAPLASLPQPPAATGQALRAVHAVLHDRHPGAAGTLDVAVVLLGSTGLYHAPRHEGRDLLSGGDPVAELLAGRQEVLARALQPLDGPTQEPASRVEVLAAVAACLPGPVERLATLVEEARRALLAAGAPAEACRLPAALALAGSCVGLPLGIDPRDMAWELLRVDQIVQAAWAALPSAGREAAPNLNPSLLNPR